MADADPSFASRGPIRLTVDVDFGHVNLFDAVAGPASIDGPWPFEDPAFQERRGGSLGSVVQLLTLKHHGPTELAFEVVGRLPAESAGADHELEMSLDVPSGRLAVAGWDTAVRAGEVAVPAGPVRLRVGWFGLEADLSKPKDSDEAEERLAVLVAAGPSEPARVVRTWHVWAPPPPERTASNGLRLYAGARANEVRATLRPMRIGLWAPYPRFPEGEISQLFEDPADGSRWGAGRGERADPILREISDAEWPAIEAEADPLRQWFYRDGDGHVWTSNAIPLRRAAVINLVPARQVEMLLEIEPDLDVEDLPAGWDRLVRLERDGTPTEVDTVGIEPGAFYQRQRADAS